MPRARITHVAIRFAGATYSMPEPYRHHDLIRQIASWTGAPYVDAHGDDQGFLDETGKYLTRQQALVSAQVNNQLKYGVPLNPNIGLFSEDIW